MAQLFTPPQTTYRQHLHGRSLYYSYQQSQTVWKDQAGVWHTQMSATSDDLTAAQVFYTTPAIVSDSIAAELILAGIGTCTPIQP